MIITVPTITESNTRRPALPEGVGFTLVQDHGDTMTVRTFDDVTDWAIENGYLLPSTVSMRQGRLALLAAGKLDQVSSAIAAIPDDAQRRAAEIEWEYATSIDRHSSLVQAITAQLDMTQAEMDALFRQAWGI